MQSLLLDYEKLQGNVEFFSLVSDYERLGVECNFSDALSILPQVAIAAGISEYAATMLYYCCLTKKYRQLALSIGVAEDVWLNTVMDLKYKLEECKAVHNEWGTFVGTWFPGFFKLERFALGRLQFEIVPLGREYRSLQVMLSPETQVLNVHIPRSGERLTPEIVASSYEQARRFYQEVFSFEVTAFVCRSWLLFPMHKTMLSVESNLAKFVADYELLDSGEYENYTELWRLFDCKVSGGTLESLPNDSSLRRSYIELMKQGKKSGWGHGIKLCK